MSDWNDHQLANISWGEGREVDDHIVPYPDDIGNNDMPDIGDNDKKTLNEKATNVKDAERRQTSNLLSDGLIQEKIDGVSASGTVTDHQLDPSLFGTSKIDYDALGQKNQLGIGPEVSGNQHEDKELGELVGNTWANIGSFDDLHQIFSNDELDGPTSLGSPNGLWSSSNDFMSGVAKSSSGNLGSNSWELGEWGNISSKTELNSEYIHDEYPSAAMSIVKTHRSKSRRITGRFVEQQGCTVSTSALGEEKDGFSANPSKYQPITNKMTDSTLSGDVYDSWLSSSAVFSHYDRLCAPFRVPNFPSAIHSHLNNTFVTPCAYKNLPQQYSSSHMVKPTDNEWPMTMTPQEKIEKLRRRQQMRAMLAIHKQQQQLSLQASCADYPLSQKSCIEDSFLRMEKAELVADENLSTFSCDPGSSNRKGNVSTISDMDEYPSADMVLYQLQDIIARLDMRLRLCIKDSLYRLAHSATQRNYASDTKGAKRSTNPDPEMAEDNLGNCNRTAGAANGETETNHLDRAVANLLFRRPFKLSVKPAEIPESSHSDRAYLEQSGSEAKSCDKNLDLLIQFTGPCQEELCSSD